jgi:hypothetical protein
LFGVTEEKRPEERCTGEIILKLMSKDKIRGFGSKKGQIVDPIEYCNKLRVPLNAGNDVVR